MPNARSRPIEQPSTLTAGRPQRRCSLRLRPTPYVRQRQDGRAVAAGPELDVERRDGTRGKFPARPESHSATRRTNASQLKPASDNRPVKHQAVAPHRVRRPIQEPGGERIYLVGPR